MKKLVALLLAVMMCVPFAACGNNEELEKYKKYETLINYLEAEDYQSAYLELVRLSEASQPEEEEQKTTEIEVNADNWQDYFEIKLTASERLNAFDEIELFYVSKSFCLKEEWQSKVVDMDVSVEYSCSDGYACYFTYNPETGEVTEGEIVDGYYVTPEQNETFTMESTSYIENGYSVCSGVYSDSFAMEDGVASIIGQMYGNVEIVRIQGTLTVTE